MSCKELVELVTDYLEGKLPSAEISRFEEHLATCDGCTHYLAQMRRTIDTVGHAPKDSLTDQQWQDLMKIFSDWKDS